MREESKRTINPMVTTMVMGYHRSRHQSLKVFTSDRYHELTAKDKAYGLEIETNCTWINVHGTSQQGRESIGALLQEVVFKEFPKDFVRWELDGSINGAECITQCMTKEFIRNHYAQFKNLFDVYLPKFGMTPNISCGMHTNISLANFGINEEKRIENAKKLYYFINKHYDLACCLLQRNPSRTTYCGRMSSRVTIQSAKEIDLHDFYDDHGSCINFGHVYETRESARRVELRLVGGQTKFAMFRNTMETIFHIMDAIKNVSWESLDKLEVVFKGCNKYVLSRLDLCRENGLLSDSVYQKIKEKSDTETEYI